MTSWEENLLLHSHVKLFINLKSQENYEKKEQGFNRN